MWYYPSVPVVISVVSTIILSIMMWAQIKENEQIEANCKELMERIIRLEDAHKRQARDIQGLHIHTEMLSKDIHEGGNTK